MIGADFISNEIKANGLCPNTFACAKSINMCVEKMEWHPEELQSTKGV